MPSCGLEDHRGLALQIAAGERLALAKALTLLESTKASDRPSAAALLSALANHAKPSLRLAISGPPGVGKSTFIEAFGPLFLAAGHRLAVLAIDPSSPRSGGSIMGDRVRMETLSADPRVFIRPSPAGQTLGGTARRTREAVLACEAAGYDMILIETVGVGQSEVLAAGMVDVFLFLHQPHSGDDLQAIKRGILELADLVAVTKADGPSLPAAKQAQLQLQQALMLARGRPSEAVQAVSAVQGQGLNELYQTLLQTIATAKANGTFIAKRSQQQSTWLLSEIKDQLHALLIAKPDYRAIFHAVEAQVTSGQLPASVGAAQLIEQLLGQSPDHS